jgi:hypothetical protein
MKVTTGGVTYEQSSKETAAYVKGLMLVWERLGKPYDCSTNTGWVLLDNIVQVWMKAWPNEVGEWKKEKLTQLQTERSIAASVKAGGYFPMSWPTRLYRLVHTLLPRQKLNSDEFIHLFLQRYPLFKMTNYKV